jgi:hypothetical protein
MLQEFCTADLTMAWLEAPNGGQRRRFAGCHAAKVVNKSAVFNAKFGCVTRKPPSDQHTVDAGHTRLANVVPNQFLCRVEPMCGVPGHVNERRHTLAIVESGGIGKPSPDVTRQVQTVSPNQTSVAPDSPFIVNQTVRKALAPRRSAEHQNLACQQGAGVVCLQQ